jgi:hypothetical protein
MWLNLGVLLYTNALFHKISMYIAESPPCPILSRVFRVQGLLCPVFVVSKVCLYPGFVMSRVCLSSVQGLSVQGLCVQGLSIQGLSVYQILKSG